MHRSRAVLTSILIALLLASSVAPSFAVTRDEFEKHRDAAANARKRAAAAETAANKLARQVAALDEQIEQIEAQAKALEPQIREASLRTERIQADVDKLTMEINGVKDEIVATQEEYALQQQLLSQRVNSTYRQGQWFYLDLLLGSTDVGDLIKRTDFVSRVIESNNDIAADLEKTEMDLNRSKTKLDRTLSAVELKRREAASVEANLRGLQNEREQRAAESAAVQSQKAGLMADNRKNAARLRALAEEEEAESLRIAAELSRAGNGSGLYAGTMVWPVPASQRVTSPYGWRICPFHGREMHPGIDIGRPSAGGDWPESDRAIVAAGSGTVIYAGYRGGYGNTVMIDHGNGVVTLYAHQASGGIMVSSGEQVSAGERIGTVGSTGNSTGPHLHFEVRVNGQPRNPMGYM